MNELKMSRSIGNTRCYISAIILGYFVIGVQPRGVTREHAPVEDIYDHYLAELVQFEMRSETDVENNHPPVIQVSTLTGQDSAEVMENLPEGTFVAQFMVTDKDSGANGEFDCKTNDRSFRIVELHPYEYKIVTRVPFDREAREEYRVTIVCDDHGEEPESTIEHLRVYVGDVNDNPPIFPHPEVEIHLAENNMMATYLLTMNATDRDTGLNGMVYYSLGEGVQDKFQIDEQSGRIIARAIFDYEETYEVQFDVIATDQGTPPLLSRTQVVVKITDTNDNLPIFEADNYEFNITEDVAVGMSIGRVCALDLDSGSYGQVIYSFSSQTKAMYGNLFHIDNRTGEIYTKAPLDYQGNHVYMLSVTAQDPVMSAAVTVTVNLVNMENYKPDIQFHTLTESGRAEVTENTIPGEVVALISVSNSNSRVNCELVEDHLFKLNRLNESQYKMVTAGMFDRERQAEYQLTIRCVDHGQPPETAIKEVTITITDMNDNLPKFLHNSSVYNVTIAENNGIGIPILQISADDRDVGRNGEISFRLYQSAQDYFRIDATSGFIYTKAALDYEQIHSIRFLVSAIDHGEPAMTSTAEVHVTISDQNDNPPAFPTATIQLQISESDPLGTRLDIPAASDRDSGPHGIQDYELVSSDDVFVLNVEKKRDGSTKLSLLLQTVLDQEVQDSYGMKVVAFDGGSPPLSGTVAVFISVLDVNDNAPIIAVNTATNNNRAEVSENVEVGTFIALVTVSDMDEGVNGQCSCMLGDDTFRMVSLSDTDYKIVTSVMLDREVQAQYNLIIRCTDNGVPPRVTVKDVQVNVLDMNDHAPLFSQSVYTASLMENNNVGIMVLQVTATDQDAGPNADIRFQLDQYGPTLFRVDSNSGIISTVSVLDYEQTHEIMFHVLAADQGQPANSASATVRVHINDVNDVNDDGP